MKKQSLYFLLFVCGVFAFTGCNNAPEQTNMSEHPSFDFEKAKGYIMNDYAGKFSEAFGKGDSAGVAALYAADAIMMPPNAESAKGTDRMAALIGSYRRMGAKNI